MTTRISKSLLQKLISDGGRIEIIISADKNSADIDIVVNTIIDTENTEFISLIGQIKERFGDYTWTAGDIVKSPHLKAALVACVGEGRLTHTHVGLYLKTFVGRPSANGTLNSFTNSGKRTYKIIKNVEKI